MATIQTRRSARTLGDRSKPIIAAASAGAALIHFAMVPMHAAESAAMGLLFAMSGWFQLAFVVAVFGWPGRPTSGPRPSRRWLVAAIVCNTAFVVAWLLSRTSGLPFGLEGGPEPFGI